MVVDLAQGDDMRIEAGNLVGQGIENSRHDRGITSYIEIHLVHPVAASGAAKQQKEQKIPQHGRLFFYFVIPGQSSVRKGEANNPEASVRSSSCGLSAHP